MPVQHLAQSIKISILVVATYCMKPKNVIFTACFVIAVLAIVISRLRHEPRAKEMFDRTPAQLQYTKHAKCRMNCRHISKKEIDEVLQKGVINLNKSDRRYRPCPTYALQGRTSDGQYIRIIFAQCDNETKVVTCYDLETDFKCHCPGDEKKN